MVDLLAKFEYPLEWKMQRVPARPVELQVLDFDKTYDYRTLWNDAVQIQLDTVVLIGPPLYHTHDFLQSSCQFLDSTQRILNWQYVPMDRAAYLVIKTHKHEDFLILRSPVGEYKFAVNQPSTEFQNKKVIVTISKNHPISWLQQWIAYHRTVHDLDGLILYNNQSEIYNSSELETALSRSDMTIKVLDYDVPFGTMGGGLWEWQGRKGNFLPWDSDFAQYVMLEHAKRRYLYNAKLAINADTDELLLFKNSTLNHIATYCESSSNSVWLYQGIWIEPVNSETKEIAQSVAWEHRHFKNYWHTNYSNQRGIGVKWLLNPAKNLQHQWMLHRTTGPHMSTDEISFAHYLAMNTSWSWQRDGYMGDVNSLVELPQLKNNLDIAYKGA